MVTDAHYGRRRTVAPPRTNPIAFRQREETNESYRLRLGSALARARRPSTRRPDQLAREAGASLVVGFTAGSATDVTGRMFAQKFSEAWGQPVIVENIAGNSGAIGTDRVAKAAPDGYTLMWSGNAAITILPACSRCRSIR